MIDVMKVIPDDRPLQNHLCIYHHHVIQIIMKIIHVIIMMLVITCWLLGSFEALPASAFEHGQQDKQPSCRSLIIIMMTMMLMMMMMIIMTDMTVMKVQNHHHHQ